MKKKKKKGFTLIEMLVVIAIIGVLATIVIVNVSRSRKKAYATKAKADMVELVKALETAASEGCRQATFTSGVLACSTGAPAGTSYINIQNAPPGINYSVTIPSTGTPATTTAGTGVWGSNIAATSITGTYTFTASGFEGTATFTCTDKTGCVCSTADGCASTQ